MNITSNLARSGDISSPELRYKSTKYAKLGTECGFIKIWFSYLNGTGAEVFCGRDAQYSSKYAIPD